MRGLSFLISHFTSILDKNQNSIYSFADGVDSLR